MTNGEKFPTAEERARAYQKFCSSSGMGCNKCPLKKVSSVRCPFEWLNLEYKEELKNCPFCGCEKISILVLHGDEKKLRCTECGAQTAVFTDEKAMIDSWNRRAYEQK